MDKEPKPIETMAVLCFACLVLFLLFKHSYWLYAGIGFIGIGIFIKPLSSFIHRGWMRFAHILGKVNGWILLGLVFFVVLTPIAIIYRFFNKDPLQLKNNSSGTYFTERNHTFTANDFEKIW